MRERPLTSTLHPTVGLLLALLLATQQHLLGSAGQVRERPLASTLHPNARIHTLPRPLRARAVELVLWHALVQGLSGML